jgi:hypothetical protein
VRIPQRLRIFIGCEGASERGYAAWLQRLADHVGLHVFLDSVVAGTGGGDPLAIVKESAKEADRRQRARGQYHEKWVILDEDKIGEVPDRDAELWRISQKKGLLVLLQRWEHEALLLRHFPSCSTLRPPAGAAMARLLQEWPTYTKPQTAIQIEAKLSLEDAVRATTQEPKLLDLLKTIGLVPNDDTE